jgi:aspartate/methionine/tyrosine aminotransferase
MNSILLPATGVKLIRFTGGSYDVPSLPSAEVKRIFEEASPQNWAEMLQYGGTAGMPSLLKELSNFMAGHKIQADPVNEIIVTTGSQEAIDLVSRVFIDKGDTILIGAPTYLQALSCFSQFNPKFVDIPIGSDGMNVEILEGKLKKIRTMGKKAKMLYIIPSFQNPDSSLMTMERRKRVLELAEAYDFIIFEDNPYGYISFTEPMPTPLAGLDKSGRVMYTSTFSKIVSPGMRIGWITANPEFTSHMIEAKNNISICNDGLSQYAAAELFKRGDVGRQISKVTKVYRTPHYHHQSRAVLTNTPVGGAARGWGAPEMAAATEIHMDRVAAALRLDPVEFRLKNMVEPFDTDLVTGLPLGDARVRECLERGAMAFDWAARRARPAGRGRFRRGVGVAAGAHKNGMFGAFPEASNMSLKMNEDGTFELNASLHEVGCGIVTTMKVIVAEVLGVHPDRIAAGEADTATTPFDYGTYGSRVTYVVGECARITAEKVKGRLLQAAAELLKEPLVHLYTGDAAVRVKNDPERVIAYRDIARLSEMRHVPSIAASVSYYAVSNPASYSVQFAEVEVDCATGLTAVTDFLAVADVGRAINRGMVEAQYQGAVQMGIGYALYEHLDVDERGRSGIDGFKNYDIVNAPDMPEVQVLLVEHEGDDGPFGAKSVGEIATVPTAPAIVNAVNNALGTELSDLPLIPERIVAALHAEEVPACSSC